MNFLKTFFLCFLMSMCFLGSSFAVGQQQNKSGQEQAQPAQEKVKFECGICLNTDGQGQPIRAAGCCHLFHNHCLRRWFQEKEGQPDCPVCRRRLNPEIFNLVDGEQRVQDLLHDGVQNQQEQSGQNQNVDPAAVIVIDSDSDEQENAQDRALEVFRTLDLQGDRVLQDNVVEDAIEEEDVDEQNSEVQDEPADVQQEEPLVQVTQDDRVVQQAQVQDTSYRSRRTRRRRNLLSVAPSSAVTQVGQNNQVGSGSGESLVGDKVTVAIMVMAIAVILKPSLLEISSKYFFAIFKTVLTFVLKTSFKVSWFAIKKIANMIVKGTWETLKFGTKSVVGFLGSAVKSSFCFAGRITLNLFSRRVWFSDK